jgi:hypothetical protein
MKRFIIGLLEIYIYIAIILCIIIIISMSNSLGISSGYMLMAFLLSIPLLFGMIIIQIDNNEVLHEINDNIKKSMPKKNSTSNKKKSPDVVL